MRMAGTSGKGELCVMRRRDEQKDKALRVSREGWTGAAFETALCIVRGHRCVRQEEGDAAESLTSAATAW